MRISSIFRFMSSWSPHAVESPADPDFAMEHSGESFITTQLMLGMTTMESYGDLSAADIQYGLEEEQRNRVLRTFVRNAFTFHLNEIFSAVRNEYTDWDKPIQHPINIRYVHPPPSVPNWMAICGRCCCVRRPFVSFRIRGHNYLQGLDDGGTQ